MQINKFFTFSTSAIVAIVAIMTIASPIQAGLINVDGKISSSEGWTQFLDARDIQVFIANDATNLYFAASTPDSAVGGNLLRVLDLNFGIDGNTGPWRYRVQSKSDPSWVRGTETSQAFSGGFTKGWSGFFDGGDDSATEPGKPFHPDNWGDLGAGLVEYSVGMNAGRREHEFAIPWAVLLDGQNGWDYNSTLTLRVAGFYVGTESTPFGNGFAWGAGPTGGVTFADQSTYALVNVMSPVPEPSSLFLVGSVLGASVLRRRRR